MRIDYHSYYLLLGTGHWACGKSMALDQYVQELDRRAVYTDLVAIRYELVPRALVDGRVQAFASADRARKHKGQKKGPARVH